MYNNPLLYIDPSGNASQGGGGGDCKGCGIGIGPGDQTGSSFDIDQFVKDSGIDKWWRKNVNGDKISDWWKRKISFNNIFGRHKNSGPPPNRSTYVELSKNFTTYKALPEMVEYNRTLQEWKKKPYLQRVIAGRPQSPYMYASSGSLGFISGGGAIKFVQYSGEGLKLLKSTELYNGAAQSEKAIIEIMSKMKAGDVSIYAKPIYTYLYNGERYILNGHHRIEAAIRSGKAIEAIELTGMKISSEFTENLLKIEEILAGLHF